MVHLKFVIFFFQIYTILKAIQYLHTCYDFCNVNKALICHLIYYYIKILKMCTIFIYSSAGTGLFYYFRLAIFSKNSFRIKTKCEHSKTQ